MDYENSTALDAQSGEQAEAVAPQDENRAEESVAGQETVVASHGDFDLIDTEEQETDEEGTAEPDTEPDVKQTQSREENAAIRAARLRARREAEAEAVKAADARFARAGVTNPLTGQPFESLAEWEKYAEAIKREQIAEQAKKTGRSVEELTEDAENRAFISRLRKDAEQRQKTAQEQANHRAFLEQDALDFIEKYPNMGANEIAKLENDKQFRRFCGTRFGREPLANLYGDYLTLIGNAGKTAVARTEKKAARSTGSGTAGGVLLSPSQKKVLDAWNAEHPEMAMTAKEFLGR